MGKTNNISAFERGSRCQAHQFVSRTATLLGFSFSCVYQQSAPTQRTSRQLWESLVSTWASIPVERVQHLVEYMPQRIEAVLDAKGVPNVYYTQCR